MPIQEIKNEDYEVVCDPGAGTITFQGELALAGPKDYAPINQLMQGLMELSPPVITIDLKGLTFLNSSGISMISKFVLGLRKKEGIQLIVLGSSKSPWQGKSLKNLQKFLPSLQLDIT